MNSSSSIRESVEQPVFNRNITREDVRKFENIAQTEPSIKTQNIAYITATIEDINATIDSLMAAIRDKQRTPPSQSQLSSFSK